MTTTTTMMETIQIELAHRAIALAKVQCVRLFSLTHSLSFCFSFPFHPSSHLFRVFSFSISFSAHSCIFSVCVRLFFPAYISAIAVAVAVVMHAYSTRRIQFLSVFRVCVFFCCCEKCVVTLLIYSVREFIQGKYMREKVNVSEFKWREC